MVSDIGLTTLLQLVTKDLYLFFAVSHPKKNRENLKWTSLSCGAVGISEAFFVFWNIDPETQTGHQMKIGGAPNDSKLPKSDGLIWG